MNQLESLNKRSVILRKFNNKIATYTDILSDRGDKITYNHDKVYNVNKERFESMECFKKYKSYTNTNNIPTFCRDI